MWFNNVRRQKYPSTLYITIKPLPSRGHYRPGIRSVLHGDIAGVRKQYDEIMQEDKE